MKRSVLYIISKKSLLLAGIMFFLIPACNEDEFLKETPLEFLAPDNAYSTVDGIRQGITGMYVAFRSDWFWGGQPQGDAWRGVGTDVAYHGEDPNSNFVLTNYLTWLIPTQSAVADFWDDCYDIIQQANVIIDRINASNPDIWESEEQKSAFIAEAMFFRAFHYRILVAYFGGVPIVTEVINSAKVDFTRNSVSEVYALIEDDLSYAASNLPGRGDEEAPGRVTNGCAFHMLCEAYLSQGKYQDAADAATEVIENLGYALMTDRFGTQIDVFPSGGDVYWDLFRYGSPNDPANTETLWAVQTEPFITGGSSWAGERYMGPAYFRWGSTPDGFPAIRGELVDGRYIGYSDSLGRPVAHVRPTNYTSYLIWQSDWDNDIRNAPHNIKRVFYFDNPASAYDGQAISTDLYPPGTRDALRDTNQYIYPYFMKFADPLNHFDQPTRAGGGFTHQDPYVLRLAETYLLRAEAYIGLNMPDEAAADINVVRGRANATPVDPADVDIDYLLDERARELYGEEWRMIVLKRVGKYVERTRLYNNNPLNPGANIQDYNVLWPIPQREIDLNIDAELTQNPGYN